MRAKFVFFILSLLLVLVLVKERTGYAADNPLVFPGGVTNAASFSKKGMPNAALAQGSMVVIFGQNLGPAVLAGTALPLQTQLAGASVRVTVAGTTVDALPVYVSARQTAAVLPSKTPTGSGTLTVTYNNQTSAPEPIQVVSSSFGVFTRNQAGTGPAIIQNYNSITDQPVNSVMEPAHPGQVMILWGTGLGPVTFDETRPPQVQNLNVEVQVLVGGKQAQIQYQGRSPQFPGVDQINFQLPADIPTGCYVPVAVRTNGLLSNFGTIAVANGPLCSDPHGFTTSDLQRIQSGGTLSLGWIQLVRLAAKISGDSFIGTSEGGLDLAYGEFFRLDGNTVRSSAGLNPGTNSPLGTCLTMPVPAYQFYVMPQRPRLQAGKMIELNGPTGSRFLPYRDGSGLYDRQPLGAWAPGSLIADYISDSTPAYLETGLFTADNGAGSAAVGAFQTSLNVASRPLVWTNRDSLTTLDKSKDTTVTWTGGVAGQDYVVIAGANFVPHILQPSLAAMFVCTERVEAGTFTIPGYLLATLPQAGGTALLGVGLAPLLDGRRLTASGLDSAYFTSMYVSLRSVTLK